MIKIDEALQSLQSGKASLDPETGKVPASELPDIGGSIVERENVVDFPLVGESGTIYIATKTNITYRWNGTTYAAIGSDLALGETASTAYPGDKGKAAYEHSQIVTGNPHGSSSSDIGAIAAIEKGAANGIAETDADNKVLGKHMPTNLLTYGDCEVGDIIPVDADTLNGKTADEIIAAASGGGGGSAEEKIAAHDASETAHDALFKAAATDAQTKASAAETAAKAASRPVGWMPTATEVGAVPVAQKGAVSGVATLDDTGKVPTVQLPAMNYDPAGSAGVVDGKLTTHVADTVKHITAAERTSWSGKADGTHIHTAAQVGARPSTWTPTAADIGAVPISRTVNGKPLTADIALTANEVAAAAKIHTHVPADVTSLSGTDYSTSRVRGISAGTSDLSAGSSALASGTIYLVYE